jgi:hypothetical protein
MPLYRYAWIAVLAAAGLFSAYALGAYHRKVRGGESYHQFYTFPKDKARPVVLRYGEGGILHSLISPHTLGGTLGLTNTNKPVKVRLELADVPEGLAVHWESSNTADFNPETKSVDRTLRPGDSISVHHTFFVGETLRGKNVIYRGGLRVIDADSDEVLLFVPIRIINPSVTKTDRTEVLP